MVCPTLEPRKRHSQASPRKAWSDIQCGCRGVSYHRAAAGMCMTICEGVRMILWALGILRGFEKGEWHSQVCILNRSPWQPCGARSGEEAVIGFTDIWAVELTEHLSDRKVCRMNPRFLAHEPGGRLWNLKSRSWFWGRNDAFSISTLSLKSLWHSEWCYSWSSSKIILGLQGKYGVKL